MPGLKDFVPFLQYGGKIDPLSEIRNAGIVTNGSVFWTKAAADADYTTFVDQVGAANVRNDFQSSMNQVRNDRNDYIIAVPQDSNTAFTPAVTAGTALVVNKSRVHLLASGYTNNSFGYMVTIQGHGTAAAYDSAIIRVEAPGFEMGGFRVLGTSGTTANGSMTAVVRLGTASTGTAHNAYLHDMSIESNLAASGGAGGTPTLVDMINTTGPNGARLDNVRLANFAGPCLPVQLNHIGANHEFYKVRAVALFAAAGDKVIGNGTGATNYALFRDCEFVQLDSATALTSAFAGSVTVKNPVLAFNVGAVNITAIGTDPTVYTAPNSPGTAAVNIPNPSIYIRGSGPIV